MSTRKSIRPLLRLRTSSPTIVSSPALSREILDSKVDTEIFEDKSEEDMTDYVPSRPLSVAIPRTSPFTASGAYCPRRPNLADILANNSPPPWTLTAFMAYLSQNHCLETLEFTMDASRYRKHYNKMSGRSPEGIPPGTDECAYVQSLWQKLLEAYIVPNGPREVNIPSQVRDSLISHYNSAVPPEPSVLDTAVQKVYELMEDSVLVPFLNSFYPQTALPDSAENTSTEDLSSPYPSRSYDERAMYRRARRERKSSPPLSTSIPASAPPAQNRSSAPSTFSQFARTLSHSARNISHSSSGSYSASARTSNSAVLSPWSSNQSESMSVGNSPADLSAGGLTDDTSASSPSALGEPMTPPTTPPQCEYVSPVSMSMPANYGTRKNEGAWKKVRSSFNFRKKSGSLREEDMEGNDI